MTSKDSQNETIWTPANVVTCVRILGVPVFVVALLSPWPLWFPQFPVLEDLKPWVAVLLFVLLAATDSVDGYLARSRNEVTTFGKFVDPLADKILVAAALLALTELSVLPSWIALVILTREFIVSGLRMIAASEGAVIAASWYGKAKTVTQIIAIVLFLVKDVCLHVTSPESPWYILAWLFMIVAVVLTIVSMVDYFVKCMPMLHIGHASDQVADVLVDDDAVDDDTVDDDVLNELAAKVVGACVDAKVSVATAESLTGGMISEHLTAIPGSSAVVKGGVVSYTFDVKEHVLGVSGEVLASEGAVCSTVAEQMAKGSKAATGADYVVAVTGIAGPGGEEPGKPVGTVWMGIATPEGVSAHECHFKGDREEVRRRTTKAALEELLAHVSR